MIREDMIREDINSGHFYSAPSSPLLLRGESSTISEAGPLLLRGGHDRRGPDRIGHDRIAETT